eukprot:Gb_03820 [translate_table: standard]
MALNGGTVVVKAPTDKRQYRIVHLPNGLTAVLVHDPEIFADSNPSALPTTKKSSNAVSDDTEEDEDEDEDDEEVDSELDTDEEETDGEDEDEEDEEDDDDDEEEDDDDEEEEEDDEEEKSVENGDRAPARAPAASGIPVKKAATAMCVGVGSFSDPLDAQGLAHFLEHMLFMGSTEYPDENEYDSYLSRHGGSSNAYTETEFTCYHFEVNRKFLKSALKRFSQFFISPLVKAEAMEREVQAVDSEFNQVLQSDSCRLQQLQCHSADPVHPFNRFTWGNKKSLMDPVTKGIDMREKILNLYKDQYLAGHMKLAVIGGEPLDTLEQWVTELFGSVRKGGLEKLNFHKEGPIWEPGNIFWVEAVKDLHVLKVTWSLPCLDKEYLKKPEDYLSHLIGHEGGGSLLSLLKVRGWATALSAGVGDGGLDRCSAGYMFVVSIDLTDSGLGKVLEVIEFLYQYVKLLREAAPQEWVFKELQDIGNLEFRFAEEQPQDDYAAELAVNLLEYPEEHIIYGDYAFEIWDPRLVEHVLSFFTPQNMRVDILTKSFDRQSPGVQYEPWFSVPYLIENIPSTLMEIWKNPPVIDPTLHLPMKNEFIPCDFSIRNLSNLKIQENLDIPKCIIDDPLIKLWYKLDRTFNVPRANTYFLITLKEAYKNVRSCVLFELYVNLLRDALNETLYQANVAKLETTFSVVGDKLELKLFGFNEKLPALLSKILNFSTSFTPTADRFEVMKEDMERNYRNTNMKPLKHSAYLRLQILREQFWHVDDKLACLLSLSLSDLTTFIPELFSQTYVEGLCHGNLSEVETITIANIFKTSLSVSVLPDELRHKEKILRLPSGVRLIQSANVKNRSEENSAVEVYFQVEQDVGPESTRARAIADLFEDIVHEPCFNQLRTKEQLGYVVDCSARMTHRVLGFCFRVQSSNYSPPYLQERIDSFIIQLQQILDAMDDKEFENYKIGLVAKKLEKDPSLIDETNHHWSQIIDKRYLFEMLKLEADELMSIEKSDIIDWYNSIFNSTSSKCRRLSIHVWGCNADKTADAETLTKLGNVIDDLPAMKLTSEFYPALC